jgi:hypothetical protein
MIVRTARLNKALTKRLAGGSAVQCIECSSEVGVCVCVGYGMSLVSGQPCQQHETCGSDGTCRDGKDGKMTDWSPEETIHTYLPT